MLVAGVSFMSGSGSRRRRVRVRYTKFQDPVYKDSCVEFFVDMFPEKRLGYVNFETNAAGTLLAAFGPDRSHRTPLWPEDLAGFEAAASIPGPVDGEHGAADWTLEYRVPLALFREALRPGRSPRAIGRRPTSTSAATRPRSPHYGAWSPVGTPAPDFHRPEFFGELVFG